MFPCQLSERCISHENITIIEEAAIFQNIISMDNHESKDTGEALRKLNIRESVSSAPLVKAISSFPSDQVRASPSVERAKAPEGGSALFQREIADE